MKIPDVQLYHAAAIHGTHVMIRLNDERVPIQYNTSLFTALKLEQRKAIRCSQQLQGASLTYKLEKIRCLNASFTKTERVLHKYQLP